MLPRLFALGVLVLIAQAQILIPASKLGLLVSKDNGATLFKREDGLSLTYVEGVGWVPPLQENLPPPQGDRLPIEVLRAAGLVLAPEVGVRYSSGPDRTRIVVDLPPDTDLSSLPLPITTLTPYPGQLRLEVPYFLPELEYLSPNPSLGFINSYGPNSTSLSLQAPPGRFYRYRTFTLENPLRYVIDLYYLTPEKTEVVQSGFTYREVWAFAPDPVRLYLLEAAPGSWRMEPVGLPGQRQVLSKLAPEALALLNGGYFDGPTGTPIGLWVKDGVMYNSPFGRSTLSWQGQTLTVGKAQFAVSVQAPDGRIVRVGLNLNRGKYTAYTLPGTVGKLGENIHLIQGERIIATYPAPFEMPQGFWALSFPPTEPIARTGDSLKLLGSLESPLVNAMEAGPLLVQDGAFAFDPNAEFFRDKAPVLATAAQSVVAWTREGGLWFVVSEPSKPEVLAQVLLERGAWGAIRMDGGSSAQLWIQGRLRNPVEGGIRPVVNGLALYPFRP